jgi:hypothetical protein
MKLSILLIALTIGAVFMKPLKADATLYYKVVGGCSWKIQKCGSKTVYHYN